MALPPNKNGTIINEIVIAMLRQRIEAALSGHADKAREAAAILCMIALLAALALFFGYHRWTSTGLHRREYEGRVIEKRLVARETQFGSKFTRRLLIEGTDGERFEVVVGEGLYNDVEAGEWVKVDRAGVDVMEVGAEGGAQ